MTGPNGKTLFLPAAGLRLEGSLYNAGSEGSYWSSSLRTYPSGAWGCFFNSGYVYMRYNSRLGGHTVRAVR